MSDREDLYQQAIEKYFDGVQDGFLGTEAARAVVDLVLDSLPEPAEREPWEVLREAASIARAHKEKHWHLCYLADDLEAEHRAAQEKAEREAAREQLIAKAVEVMNGCAYAATPTLARALADAGLLADPTDGGAA